MLLKDYRNYFIQKLTPIYDVMEAESLFNITLHELRNWRRVDVALNPKAELSAEEIVSWNAVLQQLEQQQPIQYIFGHTHFYGLDFNVNSHTLIPRPETEELVEWIIHENKGRGQIKILDIGTGSGCIAVSLAKNLPDALVFAVDVSEEALKVAKSNALANNVNVTLIQQDILAAETLPGNFDIIVSNPPYVRNLEKAELKQNVLHYEPHLALFVEDNDPLIFYNKIAALAKANLPANGKLYFEINQYLGNETLQMLIKFGFANVILKKDMYGNDRMVSAIL